MPMFRRSMLVFIALVLSAAGAAFYGASAQEESVILDAAERPSVSESAPTRIAVYVTGAVARPGVVELNDGARAQEAVELCGGLLPTADAASVNMAQTLKDGMQIRVAEKAVAEVPASGAQGAGKEADGKINLNTADEKALDSLPGIGPVMAKHIIEYRSNTPFQSVEDLKKVKGIGNAKFEKIKDKVTI